MNLALGGGTISLFLHAILILAARNSCAFVPPPPTILYYPNSAASNGNGRTNCVVLYRNQKNRNALLQALNNENENDDSSTVEDKNAKDDVNTATTTTSKTTTTSTASSSILSSLPLPSSPKTILKNITEGTLGQRGEQYVIAQFTLLLCIAIGTIPLIPFGNAIITSFLGPSLLLFGLFLVYKSAFDLQTNLSPWPVPTDPNSGRGSLIRSGIYAYIRHPMYAGVLSGMVGLSIVTEDVVRMVLTWLLYFVLDAKSGYEEVKLVEVYGEEYEGYREEVRGKFFPEDWKTVFTLK